MTDIFDSHVEKLIKNPIVHIVKSFGKVYVFGGYLRDVLADCKPEDVDLFVITENYEKIRYALEFFQKTFCAAKEKNFFDIDIIERENYEGLLLRGIKIIRTAMGGKDMPTERIDVIIGEKIDIDNTDFDVNAMYIELSEGSVVSKVDGDQLEPLSEEEILSLAARIKAKKLNFLHDVDHLIKFHGTGNGEKQIFKRCIKRFLSPWRYNDEKKFHQFECWELEPTEKNIKVVEYLLKTVNPNSFKARYLCREAQECGVIMLYFLQKSDQNGEHRDFLKTEHDRKIWREPMFKFYKTLCNDYLRFRDRVDFAVLDKVISYYGLAEESVA